jgi:hypothetical protein
MENKNVLDFRNFSALVLVAATISWIFRVFFSTPSTNKNVPIAN